MPCGEDRTLLLLAVDTIPTFLLLLPGARGFAPDTIPAVAEDDTTGLGDGYLNTGSPPLPEVVVVGLPHAPVADVRGGEPWMEFLGE